MDNQPVENMKPAIYSPFKLKPLEKEKSELKANLHSLNITVLIINAFRTTTRITFSLNLQNKILALNVKVYIINLL